jgi:hypothetical protein
LAGYIGAIGLLKRAACTDGIENQAWAYYRTDPHDRLPGDYEALRDVMHDRAATRITCLGVFDTVGALGVPLERFRHWNAVKYSFHNVELGGKCDFNFHAVAVDERRGPFEAALWFKPRFHHFRAIVTEQVWFAGCHSDIGGGYVVRNGLVEGDHSGLDDLALDWMIKRVRDHTKLPLHAWSGLEALQPNLFQPMHDSLSGFYYLMRRVVRRINASKPRLNWLERYPQQRPFSDVIAEMVHISALERLGCEAPIEKSAWPNFWPFSGRWLRRKLGLGTRIKNQLYAPKNLLAALQSIEKAYGAQGVDPLMPSTLIVDWSGKPLNPDDAIDIVRARSLIKQAYERLGRHKHITF